MKRRRRVSADLPPPRSRKEWIMPETTLQFQNYPLKAFFFLLLIQASAGAAGGCSLILLHKLLQCLPCFLSQKWADFSSCKINIFQYRVTWSAELESILVLLGLKCEQPQIFQELETSKSGSGFAFPWNTSMVQRSWYALHCSSGEVTVSTCLSQFHLKLDVQFLRHVWCINLLRAFL